MKTLLVTAAAAIAVATLTLPGNAYAAKPKRQTKSSVLKAPSYPKYRLVDLGTLGGASSGPVEVGVSLNNRGETVAFSATSTPDPFPDLPLQDGTIWHAVLSNANGVVRDLGGIGGNQSLPTWISDSGLIAGLGENGQFDDLAGFPQLRALYWDATRQLFDLGTLGGNSSQAEAVNSRGQVVGQAANTVPEDPNIASFFNAAIPAAQQVRAFLWQNGAMRDLGTLGGNDSSASAINERGDVAGLSATDNVINDATGLPTVHPFLYTDGVMRDLGTLGGSFAMPGSLAYGSFGHVINESRQVIGTSYLAGDNDWHAFLSQNGEIIDLGTLGGNRSEAVALNDVGQIVGRANTTVAGNSRHPFLWDNGRMNDLGVASPCARGTAMSVNNSGEVVGGFGGCSDDPDQVGYFRAFYWHKGSPIVLLDNLLTQPSDMVLDNAVAINDRGEINAIGKLPDGSSRAVLLVPVSK